jgi:predicted kinase
VLLVVTGPIASGKSTLARAIACEFGARGAKAAAIDLDLIYEMLDPARAPKTDQAKWAQVRRVTARLAATILAEGVGVVVEGEFVTPAERAEFTEALPPGVEPRFVTLSVSYDVALQRATRDRTRGMSRDPVFLRDHYEATAQAAREVPATDLALDTGAMGVAEAARVVSDWASRQ